MYSPNHPTYILHPELAESAFANTGGLPIPSRRWFQRNDSEKRWLEELQINPTELARHKAREAEFQQQLHNNLY